MSKTNIAIDAMGGDNAPNSVIDGLAISFIRHPETHFIIYGDKSKIAPLMKNKKELIPVCTLIDVKNSIKDDEKASKTLRKMEPTSMSMAIECVSSGKADAIVSGGNSGALMALSIFGLKRILGINRPAMAAVMPTKIGEVIALDLGANVECSTQNLLEFALLGVIFAQKVLGKPEPRLGLLNVGEEENKGKQIINEAANYILNSQLAPFFKGYVEGNKIVLGDYDVVVCDGFSGNIMLKTAEGTADLCTYFMRQVLSSNLFGKLAYFFGRSSFSALRDKLDPRKHNGAVLLGLNGIVVKSHGGTDALGFAHAVDLAVDMAEGGYNSAISSEIEKLKLKENNL